VNEARQGRFASPHVNLSALYNRAGNSEKALWHADKALALDPRADGAWFQKGRAEEREGRLEAAVAALNQAVALNARSSSYYYVLAGLYRRLGRTEESKAALDAFKRLDRETSELDAMRRRDSRANAVAPGPEG
jgi:tetratricopeptide (TPR) repeat protein